jgi:ABC-type phosphate/phosphonate transport system substrate-binding protein
MPADWVASLPMYDFPELRGAHDEFWGALAGRLASVGLKDAPRSLTRGASPAEVWGNDRLLFAQGCEYPLAKAFSDRVRVVANPVHAAAGCEGARYRSAIVVRIADARGDGLPAGDGVVSMPDAGSGARRAAVGEIRAVAGEVLARLRGRRCVINELDSNSGMNLLRAAVAPLASGGRFFGSVAVSGSHLRSVEMVASGEADVASIDCVSFAHFQRLYPLLVRGLQVLGWTASSPSLPYITSHSTSDATVHVLRNALADVFDDSRLAAVRERLLLRGVDLAPAPGFGEVLGLERQAADAGYPVLR